jgi:hypothetical protein
MGVGEPPINSTIFKVVGLAWTRIFSPFKSSGLVMGFLA